MTFEDTVRKAAEDRGIKHPDDIEFLRQDMRLGWDAAMVSLGGTPGSTPDQVRVVKLRTRWLLLEQDVRAKIDETNRASLKHALERQARNSDTSFPSIKSTAELLLDSEVRGYASTLDLIHTHMRELDLDYPG